MVLENDLISVGIPAYNHEYYIQETIRSIINQTYKNIELIILDDGSTDSTWEKIQEIKQECEERFVRIHFEKQKNIGCSRTNHKLITLAKGKYYMVLASDDLAKPNAIEVEHKFLSENPDYVSCVGDNDLIDSESNYVFMDQNKNITTSDAPLAFSTKFSRSMWDLDKSFGTKYKHRSDWRKLEEVTYNDLWRGNKFPNAGLYRTDAIKKVDRTNVMWACDDWSLHVQLLKIGKYKVLPDILGSYRLHETQQIRNTNKFISEIRTTQFHEIHLLETQFLHLLTPELQENWWFTSLKNEFDNTKKSRYWDEKFYIKKYPEVLEQGYIPLVHYLGVGKYLGYAPHKKFINLKTNLEYPNLALVGHKFIGFEYYKNKIRYKIWRHFSKILIKKGILNPKLSLEKSIVLKTNPYFYKTIDNTYSKYKKNIKNFLTKKKRQNIIKKFNSGQKLKICFLAQRPNMCCFEHLYNLFKLDNRFEPIVVVMPDARYNKQTMLEHLNNTYDELTEKELKPILGYNINNNKVMNFRKVINPDIIFYQEFWKPHFKKEFYINNFKDKITLLNDYGFSVTQEEMTCNFELNNLVDIYFRPSDIHVNMAKKIMNNEGINTVATGSPKLDSIFDSRYKPVDVWKNQDRPKKRVIWAPHYNAKTPKSFYQNDGFWFLYDYMFKIAEKYSDKVQFVFRPHPVLYSTIVDAWGKQRADEYYAKWDNLANGQLFMGNFIDLFATSDAMIMDCCSFMAEYTIFNKPLFHTVTKTSRTHLNEFGEILYKNFYVPQNNLEEDIENFIQDVVINGNDYKKEQRTQFVQQYFGKINGKTASENIYDEIIKFLEKGEV